MANFTGLDFLRLDELLSDEERLARDTVRDWVTREFLPRIQEHVRSDGKFPMELVTGIAELGLFGANLSGYGCAGMNNVAYGLVMQELERGDSGLRSFASVQGSLVMYPIHTYGSDAQKERWLPELAAGRAIGCFGLTEPDAGSNVGAMRTRAMRRGGGWVLSGTKRWITNGTLADVSLVWATTDDGVRGFLVERGRPGFETRDIKGKFSLRGSVTSELFLSNVRVPEANRLPNVKGLKGPLGCLTQARYGITWGPIGAAIACFTEATEYAKNRILFNRPIAATQAVQLKLAEMARRITLAQLLSLQLGRLKDAGKMQPTQVSLAKWNNCRMAIDIAREARDILGGAGITTEYCPIRHALNLESVITYEGTETVHQLV